MTGTQNDGTENVLQKEHPLYSLQTHLLGGGGVIKEHHHNVYSLNGIFINTCFFMRSSPQGAGFSCRGCLNQAAPPLSLFSYVLFLSDASSTYIHPATGSTSALDLSICGPSLVLDYEWTIHEDLCGSDHFPVILTSNAVEEDAAPNRWNFKKADWLSFQAQCSSELTEEAVMSAEDPAGQFTDLLIKAAHKTVPKTCFSKKLPKVPWFNDSCKRAIKERKKAQRKFFSNPTLSNVQNFKLGKLSGK